MPEVKEGIESKRQSGIDYGVYGAKYIYDLSGEYGPNGRIVGELLANVICYHHGGLPDAEDFNGDSPLLMRLQDENRLTDYEQVKVAFFKDLQITEQEIEQLFKKSVEEIKLLILKSSTGSEAKIRENLISSICLSTQRIKRQIPHQIVSFV